MSDNRITMRTNFAEVYAALDRLPEKVGNQAMVRALNDTVDQGRTQMAREISQEYRISVGDAKNRLTIRRAMAKGGVLRFEAALSASDKGKGRSMNLIAFVDKSITLAQARKRMKAGEGGTQTLRSGGQVQKALQLTLQIKRSGGKKTIKGAFIGNDGRTVFIRDGKGRMPIHALNTIGVPQMFNAKRLNAVVVDAMLKRFTGNFQREVRVVLGGWAR